jgi:phage terminase large subunit
MKCDDRWLILVGGAGSGKSVFCSMKVVFRLMMESGHNALVLRKVGADLRDSCWKEIRKRITELGVWHLWSETKQPLRLVYKPNGNEVIFRGLDDAEKIKSIEGVTLVWVEEATATLPGDLRELNRRVRGHSEHY